MSNDICCFNCGYRYDPGNGWYMDDPARAHCPRCGLALKFQKEGASTDIRASKKTDMFIVIPRKDIDDILGSKARDDLEGVLWSIASERQQMGKHNDNQYIVINQDEPYANIIWEIILRCEAAKLKQRKKPLIQIDGLELSMDAPKNEGDAGGNRER